VPVPLFRGGSQGTANYPRGRISGRVVWQAGQVPAAFGKGVPLMVRRLHEITLLLAVAATVDWKYVGWMRPLVADLGPQATLVKLATILVPALLSIAFGTTLIWRNWRTRNFLPLRSAVTHSAATLLGAWLTAIFVQTILFLPLTFACLAGGWVLAVFLVLPYLVFLVRTKRPTSLLLDALLVPVAGMLIHAGVLHLQFGERRESIEHLLHWWTWVGMGLLAAAAGGAAMFACRRARIPTIVGFAGAVILLVIALYWSSSYHGF
jgi:hypothetical protein